MRILVVDDTPVQSASLVSLLQSADFTDIVTAGSGLEALRLLRQRGPIDLVLMDLMMPGVTGVETCRLMKISEEWSEIPVIMVTSSDDTEDLHQAFAAGATDYITKPPEVVELLARVRAALRLKEETTRRKAREQSLIQLNVRLEDVLTDLDEKHQLLRFEQEKSERLLLNILPQTIADRLKEHPGVIAERYEAVTILFADIVSFTEYAAQVTPEALVSALNEVFSLLDRLAEKHGLEKIKTIGDAYMAVAGLPVPRPDHAKAAADMALDILEEVPKAVGGALQIRVGLHTGPVVAGVIGERKFSYDLWGDTVNIASRMESQGAPGAIQVSSATYSLLQDGYLFEPRGSISVRGKGPMETFLLRGRSAWQTHASPWEPLSNKAQPSRATRLLSSPPFATETKAHS
jgi:adenylate cyclase